MRIAIYYNLPPGGARRTVIEELRFLSSRHHVDVYTLNQKTKNVSQIQELVHGFYPYSYKNKYKLPIPEVIKDFFDYVILPRVHQRIANKINTGNYDVVLVHPDLNTQAPYILRFLKVPNVYYCQEYLRIGYEKELGFSENVGRFNRWYEEKRRKIRKNIDMKNAQKARLILANSIFSKNKLAKAYSKIIEVNYLGVNPKVFEKIKKNKKQYFFFVGSKSAQKGWDFLEKALGLIPLKLRPEIKLLNVYSKKALNNDFEMSKIYSQAQATLCLGVKEPFGLSAVESMACGTPVIAVNEGGFRETVVDGKTGFLIKRDPRVLAQTLLKFIKNKKLSEGFTKDSVKRATTKFTWERHNQSLEKTLRRVGSPSKILISGQDSGGWGGSEKFLISLAKNLKILGKDVSFTSVSGSKFTQKIKEFKFSLKTIPFRMDIIGGIKGFLKFFILFPLSFVINFYLLFVFKKEGGKIIILPSFSDKLFLTSLAKYLNLKIVWIEYGPLEPLFKKNFGIGKLFYKPISQFSDLLIVPTHNTLKHIQALNFIPESKLKLIPVGIEKINDQNISKAQKKALYWQKKLFLKGKKIVGMVSRVEKEKGQDTLIRAVARLNKTIPNLVCLIVGEGDTGYLKRVIKNEKVNNVILLGYQKEVESLISLLDVFVFPSRWALEGFGIAPLEAMQFDVPVVASNVGPVPEVVGAGGLIVSPDVKSVARGIKKVLFDKALRKKLIQEGHRRVETFDISNVTQQYKMILDTTLYEQDKI
jgi:glycosyltransferase involved in cell wall biosynthesis